MGATLSPALGPSTPGQSPRRQRERVRTHFCGKVPELLPGAPALSLRFGWPLRTAWVRGRPAPPRPVSSSHDCTRRLPARAVNLYREMARRERARSSDSRRRVDTSGRTVPSGGTTSESSPCHVGESPDTLGLAVRPAHLPPGPPLCRPPGERRPLTALPTRPGPWGPPPPGLPPSLPRPLSCANSADAFLLRPRAPCTPSHAMRAARGRGFMSTPHRLSCSLGGAHGAGNKGAASTAQAAAGTVNHTRLPRELRAHGFNDPARPGLSDD